MRPERAAARRSASGAIPIFRPTRHSKCRRWSRTLADGKLHARGPYYGGTHLDLGPSACLRIGGVRVAVSSQIAQMADRAMFRFVGIEPERQAILVVKSSTHFRADFAPIASQVLIGLAPGPMPYNPADLPFTRLRDGLRLCPNGPAFETARAATARPDRTGPTVGAVQQT